MIAKLNTLVAAALIAAASLSAQQTGTLKTKVDPGRAGVFVDGKYVGPAGNFGIGRKYTLAAGEHKIKLVEPRYEDVETTVKIHVQHILRKLDVSSRVHAAVIATEHGLA